MLIRINDFGNETGKVYKPLGDKGDAMTFSRRDDGRVIASKIDRVLHKEIKCLPIDVNKEAWHEALQQVRLQLDGIERQLVKPDLIPDVKDQDVDVALCILCGGPTNEAHPWTFSQEINRVHTDPDTCVSFLHPDISAAFSSNNSH